MRLNSFLCHLFFYAVLTTISDAQSTSDSQITGSQSKDENTTVTSASTTADEENLVTATYGILIVRKREANDSDQIVSKHKTCVAYYPDLSTVPETEEDIEYLPLVDVLNWAPCSSVPPVDLSHHIAILNGSANYSDCSITDRALSVERYGGNGTLFITPLRAPKLNDTEEDIWLAVMLENTYKAMLNLSDPSHIDVALYSPAVSGGLNFSIVIIWLLATGTVAIGAYWSGRTRYNLYKVTHPYILSSPDSPNVPSIAVGSQCRPNDAVTEDLTTDHSAPPVTSIFEASAHQEEPSLNITPKLALMFVVLMCVMLLSLYFLYPYLVYFIQALFCFASAAAIYACLEPLVMRLPCGTCQTPYFNLYMIKGTLELRQIILLLFAASFSITWFVVRHQPYAWILQDIMGVAFCVNMLRVVRLPSLKIATLLLSCLFFYDIFFVFITPLFTSSGTSIMVDVAAGGASGSGEQLPMVFVVPHFVYNEITTVCNLRNNQNLLGFGDVMVPGMLVAFAYSFDLRVRGEKFPIYYTLNIVAYGIGLLLTFLGLYLMRGAQPALLYLVPCTVIPTVVCAAIRGELSVMWIGDSVQSGECKSLLRNDNAVYVNESLGDETTQHNEGPVRPTNTESSTQPPTDTK